MSARIPLPDTDLPLVAAPMAGGPTSPELVDAVGAAGALPIVAGGYLSPDALAARIDRARATGRPFGVNLFAPGPDGPAALDRAAFDRYAVALAPEAAALGVRLDPEPQRDDDAWADKLALLLEDPVPLVTVTFALPEVAAIAALRRTGTCVLVTVTTPAEARAAAGAGADGLVVQGARAGGHCGTWDPAREIGDEPTADVVRAVRAVTDLPMIAAGGVDSPGAVRALLAAGAEAAAVGTLLLRADEAGTSPVHRAALADPGRGETAITRAYTGRPARSLRTAFMDRHRDAPTAYPAIHHLTRALRARAAATGDVERVHLWAGTGHRAARQLPAAEILRDLAAGV